MCVGGKNKWGCFTVHHPELPPAVKLKRCWYCWEGGKKKKRSLTKRQGRCPSKKYWVETFFQPPEPLGIRQPTNVGVVFIPHLSSRRMCSSAALAVADSEAGADECECSFFSVSSWAQWDGRGKHPDNVQPLYEPTPPLPRWENRTRLLQWLWKILIYKSYFKFSDFLFSFSFPLHQMRACQITYRAARGRSVSLWGNRGSNPVPSLRYGNSC